MLFAMLFSFILMQDSQAEAKPYYLVLTNSKVMKAKTPPKMQGRLATVTLLDGKVISLPARMIDSTETEKYNARVAEKEAKRKEAEAAAAAAEAEAAAKRELRRQKKQEALKKLQLRVDDALPSYERVNKTAAATDDSAAASQPKGSPVVNTFTSNDPVFVYQETIRPYTDRSDIICVVKVQSSSGAENIRVKLTVRFSPEGEETMEQMVDGALAFDQTTTLTFNIAKPDTIVETFYEVSATIKE